MTSTGTSPLVEQTSTAPGAPAQPARLGPVYRFELVKLLGQWRIRGLLAVLGVAPFAFVAAIASQSSLPGDTVFGRWMLSSGWAAALVVLAFCCSWPLPLLAVLVTGDIFAVEDRVGTWRQLLVAVRSPRRIVTAKALAGLTALALLLAVLTCASIAAGLLLVGNQPLVGLDGRVVPAGEAAGLVVVAWLYVAVAVAAYAAIGLLGSVAFGRSPVGLLGPAVVALVLQTGTMLPMPSPVRHALPGTALLAWRGLFTEPRQIGPMAVGLAVCLAWTLVATGGAYRLFTRRDATDLAYEGGARRVLTWAVAPLVTVSLVTAGVLALAADRTSGVHQAEVERSLATAFGHLYVLQTRELHRPAVTEAQLTPRATCDKGGPQVADEGPGNDWRCVVTWRLPGATAVGSAIYQLDIAPEGRYAADGDGPKEVNGYFRVHTPSGDAPNPLWQIDGLVDLLSPGTTTSRTEG